MPGKPPQPLRRHASPHRHAKRLPKRSGLRRPEGPSHNDDEHADPPSTPALRPSAYGHQTRQDARAIPVCRCAGRSVAESCAPGPRHRRRGRRRRRRHRWGCRAACDVIRKSSASKRSQAAPLRRIHGQRSRGLIRRGGVASRRTRTGNRPRGGRVGETSSSASRGRWGNRDRVPALRRPAPACRG